LKREKKIEKEGNDGEVVTLEKNKETKDGTKKKKNNNKTKKQKPKVTIKNERKK
jgi:hypothetical protein